jgi:CRP-like cAMP-binding protein
VERTGGRGLGEPGGSVSGKVVCGLSPRFVPATVSELSRVPLLAALSGEELTRIAKRMEREEVPPGRQVVREGDPGERFYLVLSGIFAVSQEDLGPRRVLQPGDYFGEVALAMNVPRTASVRALTPAVVASCDRETFDELLRPLFAQD